MYVTQSLQKLTYLKLNQDNVSVSDNITITFNEAIQPESVKNNIEVKIHYPKALNNQPAFRKKNYKRNRFNFKNSDKQSKMLLTLPVHQFISRRQQDFLIKKMKQFYEY